MSEIAEIEVKFLVEDEQTLRRKLTALEANPHGRAFETNICYEDDQKQFQAAGSLLRLRKDRRSWLTFKYASDEMSRNFKILNELEVQVSDFETMDQVLRRMGYHHERVYEKWRETFDLGDAMLCLDNMPYGTFLEIEGSREAIRELARRLRFDWRRRILINYLAIFEHLKRTAGLTFNDVTFDNFKTIVVSFNKLIRACEAG
jgi:adenylate cyclase class 2